MDLNSMYRVAS